jgi:enoyl-CoA hydratase
MGEGREETAGGLASFWRRRLLRGRPFSHAKAHSSSDECLPCPRRRGGSSGAGFAVLVSYLTIRSVLDDAMREASHETVSTRADGRVTVVTIERPERRNALDLATARALFDAFQRFDADLDSDVAVLTGAGGAFCAGADLKAIAEGETRPIQPDGDFGPMGPTRLKLGKPVIAAIEGPAVAGGMELALWCDLRIAARSAVFGLFNRRFGVPLIDLGTIRLPRIIGHGRALELILTGRAVGAEEALSIGLVNELTEDGRALARAVALARTLCGFPQAAMRNDRMSAIEQWDLSGAAAIANEVAWGLKTLASGEASAGSALFRGGAGRHGRPIGEIDNNSTPQS